jgi:PAS domain S-box-containing protein
MVQLEIGTVVGTFGQRVPVDVVLRPTGLAITHVEHAFEPPANGPIPELPSGAPECEPGPGIAVESSEFAFVPAGCEVFDTCTGVRAVVTASAPIPDGAVVYRCNVLVSDSTEMDCREPIRCGTGLARAPDTAPGSSLPVNCRDGEVATNFALFEPIWGTVIAEPPEPLVGEQVRVSFVDAPQLPYLIPWFDLSVATELAAANYWGMSISRLAHGSNGAHGARFTVSARGVIEDADASACTLLGYSMQEMIGMHGSELVPLAAHSSTAASLDRMRRGEITSRLGRLQHKNGTVLEVEVTARSLSEGRLLLVVHHLLG